MTTPRRGFTLVEMLVTLTVLTAFYFAVGTWAFKRRHELV